jgi:hypothetical protein
MGISIFLSVEIAVKRRTIMDNKVYIDPVVDIDEKKSGLKRSNGDNEENGNGLAKLLADVIVENIIKKYRNGRNRICKDQ